MHPYVSMSLGPRRRVQWDARTKGAGVSETTEAEEVAELEQAMRNADEPDFDIPRIVPYRQFATIAVKFMRQRLDGRVRPGGHRRGHGRPGEAD